MMHTTKHPFRVVDPSGLEHVFTMLYPNTGEYGDLHSEYRKAVKCSCGSEHPYDPITNVVDFGLLESKVDLKIDLGNICRILEIRGGNDIPLGDKKKTISIICKLPDQLKVTHVLGKNTNGMSASTIYPVPCSCKKVSEVRVDRFSKKHEHFVDKDCHLVYLSTKKWNVEVLLGNNYFA